MDNLVKESLVIFETSQGLELRAGVLGLSRYHVAFELYSSAPVLRLSEVLNGFKIVLNDQTLYAGRAVVASLVATGTVTVCEAKLDESSFALTSFQPSETSAHVRGGFEEFFNQWQRVYKVLPEFKVVIADMQTFLMDLRLWLEQVELQIRSMPSGNRLEAEQQAVAEIGQAMVPAFDAMHERLEALSASIPEELRPVHQNFAKRQLHSLVLCSPFAYRTFHKPLGYAGDYEMVNMIARNPYEGSSLFAKVVNLWFLCQWPAKAHRNRIAYLKHMLEQESLRGARRGRPIRIMNLGCGPAREIQQFLAESTVCEQSQFTLLDFNEETVQYTTRILNELKQRYGRRTPIQMQKKSVNHVLKEGAKPAVNGAEQAFDLIYCAGLFDYLSDRTCKQLMNVFYDRVAPGGLVVATNVDDTKPFRHMLEFVLDWHLIYRDENRGATLVPSAAPEDAIRVQRDDTSVNLFIEVRKPDHV